MALPISVWFWSNRWVVGSLSGKSAAALTMKRRVQVMWSSQSLRISLWKSERLVAGGAASAGKQKATENRKVRVKIIVLRFILGLLPETVSVAAPFGSGSVRFELRDNEIMERK